MKYDKFDYKNPRKIECPVCKVEFTRSINDPLQHKNVLTGYLCALYIDAGKSELNIENKSQCVRCKELFVFREWMKLTPYNINFGCYENCQ